MTEYKNLPMPVVVLISGNGSNLQALIDRQQELNIEIAGVISNREDAYGLQRAGNADISTQVIKHQDFSDRKGYDAALLKAIEQWTPGLVILAGFMRLLTPHFTEHFAGRLLNIHPSLLPKYKGLHTHERVIEAGEANHGSTVHFVTAELDGGPLILQAKVPVHPEDQPETLGKRVQQQEYIIYPLSIQWFACGRLKLQQNSPMLDDKPLPKQGLTFKSELLTADWRHSS